MKAAVSYMQTALGSLARGGIEDARGTHLVHTASRPTMDCSRLQSTCSFPAVGGLLMRKRQKPDPEVVAAVEEQCRIAARARGEDPSTLVFPESYPTSCLVGCVDVADCLTAEECTERV
jgi:hypothetical protein